MELPWLGEAYGRKEASSDKNVLQRWSLARLLERLERRPYSLGPQPPDKTWGCVRRLSGLCNNCVRIRPAV